MLLCSNGFMSSKNVALGNCVLATYLPERDRERVAWPLIAPCDIFVPVGGLPAQSGSRRSSACDLWMFERVVSGRRRARKPVEKQSRHEPPRRLIAPHCCAFLRRPAHWAHLLACRRILEPTGRLPLFSFAVCCYPPRRSGGRVVEGTPLLRVQAGNRLEGSNPFRSATCPRESVLPIRLRPDFLVDCEGYAGRAEHRPRGQEARKRSLRAEILRTS